MATRNEHIILLKLPNIPFLNSFVFPYDSFKSTPVILSNCNKVMSLFICKSIVTNDRHDCTEA